MKQTENYCVDMKSAGIISMVEDTGDNGRYGMYNMSVNAIISVNNDHSKNA